jgi:hypothetical protein
MEGTAPLVVSTASHGPARFSTRRGSRSNGGALEDARAARRAVAVGGPGGLRLDLRWYGSGGASASVATGASVPAGASSFIPVSSSPQFSPV